jgi:hypothetical protein
MAVVAKVVVELRFKRRIPRKTLEDIVTLIGENRDAMFDAYKMYDKGMITKVWFEDYSRRTGNNPFIKMFKR